MFVQETRLQNVLSGTSQYRVPLYQRPYSWTPKQLGRLWDDLVELTEIRIAHPGATHFTGSLVLSVGQVGPAASEFLVVDGQQRLTTLSVLLCALRDHYREVEGEVSRAAERIHETYLIDRFRNGDDRLRLIPTQADRGAYRSIIDGNTEGAPNSGIMEAYRFFRTRLHIADDPDDDADIQRMEAAALTGLVFVSITADRNDNVYRIFESLNNTGMKLTQGDLLRNYLFMRLGSEGEAIYESWWLPMQRNLSSGDLETLFWLDYVWTHPEGKQSDIYSLQVERLRHLEPPDIVSEVKRYSRLSSLFRLMRHPSEEVDVTVRAALERLNAWGLVAADPIVMHLLRLRDQGLLDGEQMARGLHLIESFMVRRVLIGAPPNALNRIMNRAALEVGETNAVEALHRYLSIGRKFFATDAQIAEAVVTKHFYYIGRPNQRKAILGWLEEVTPLEVAGRSFRAKEQVDLKSTTIEHIMPQTLTDAWRNELATDLGEFASVDDLHDALVHTLANLTLTAYNTELSNDAFAKKRDLLEHSGLRMNDEIASSRRWRRTEMLTRGGTLADRICQLWVGPLADTEAAEPGTPWKLVADLVSAIPLGRWATYGDVAAVAGTHPVPLGAFLGRTGIQGAWRVLKSSGSISPGFVWPLGSAYEGKDPIAVLESEGIRFDVEACADAGQRLRVPELGDLIGLTIASDVDQQEETADEREAFIAELGERQSPLAVQGVVDVINAWQRLGGYLNFGSAQEVSCFLMANGGPSRPNTICPLIIYPSGRIEVVFQYLMTRAPFDEPELRDELRTRLNGISNVDLEEDRLDKRPSFNLEILADSESRKRVIDTLEWFVSELDRFDVEIADEVLAG